MRAAYLLPLLALPAAAAQLAERHGDDEDEGEMMEMHGGDHGGHDDAAAYTTTVLAASSSASASTSAATHAAAAPAHNAHDPHGHHSHAPVKEFLNDTDVHLWHRFPPTYMDADFRLTKDQAVFGEDLGEGWDPASVAAHPGLMGVHVGSMVVAYFGALPVSLALRAAGHPSHYLANGVFLAVAILGWLAGVAYKAAMPNMYEGAKHGVIGNILVLTSIVLAVCDSLGLIARAVAYYRAGNRDWKSFFADALHSAREDRLAEAANYEIVGMVDEPQRAVFDLGDDDDDDDSAPSSGRVSPRTRGHRHSPSRHSTGSEGTLQDTPTSSRSSAHMFEMEMGADRVKGKQPLSHAGAFDAHPEDHHRQHHHHHTPRWIEAPAAAPVKLNERGPSAVRVGEVLLTWVRRTQVVVAYVAVCTGIPVYVGMCRAGFINTCAAHIIKGSIFFGYGVLTFARYLGAYADLGWAWNAKPAGSTAVSAEMVECAVIFVYGITNTWMERFGSQHGDPYTVKQVQHISIAVMFWFAGLSGMLLESKRVRRALAAVMYTGGGDGARAPRQPVTYSFSFNPLPGLVIAITGLAMAAHHQDYKFQVEIHSLWGLLLAGGSMFRFITYFFLWLRPPTDSALPSRPPTEVLTSFGWAAGGIVFMLSDEEVAFAAMRSGFDDMMAFLNLTVALTCFVFCWIVIVLAVKGYALFRMKRGVQLAVEDGQA